MFISLRDFFPGSLFLPVPTLGRPPVERVPFVATGTHAVANSSPKGGLSGAWLTSCPVIMFRNLGVVWAPKFLLLMLFLSPVPLL